MTPDDLLKIREKFASDAADYVSRRSSEHNSFGAFILSDNSYFLVGKWVCHGWLSDNNITGYIKNREKLKIGIKYVLSAVMTPWVTEDKLLAYIDWLVNRSPWEKIFLDKDAKSVRKLGYLIDANYPSSFIGSAMIASRFMTESYSGDRWQTRCHLYQELLEVGCTENEAFIFSHIYDSTTYKSLYPVSFSTLSSGHSTFYATYYQENYVRNFLSGTPVNVGKNTLAQGRGYEYSSLNSTWGDATGKNSFLDKVSSLVPVHKHLKQDLHIFRRIISKDQYQILDREDFSSIISQLRECLYA